ncbi:hypothetical protein K7432_007131 [Basidiobolus ranarum]|uniref:Uncharacterized protein n=1 Tax=Basidiobolus ranarum TaxID=34480 RepID=A0ABR2WTR8_9FUNG
MESYISLADRRSSEAIFESLNKDLAGSQVSNLQARQKLVAALVSDLSNEEVYTHWDQKALLLVLQGLKMLCREVDAAKSLYTSEGIRALMRHSELLPTTSGDDSVTVQESLRCLANCLLLDASTRRIFYNEGGVGFVASKILSSSLSMDSEFLFGRILFLATVSSPEAVSTLADNAEFLSKIDSIICKCISPPSAVSSSVFSSAMIISEYLKMLFNMITNFVSCTDTKNPEDDDQASKQELSAKYSSLIPTLIRVVTEIPYDNSAPVSPPHSHVIHVLLNISITGLEPLWFSQDSQEPYILVTTLIEMLKGVLSNCFAEDTHSSDDLTSLDSFLPPFLILMSNLARENSHACSLMKESLLPENIDRSKPLGKGQSVSDYLISLLTAGAVNRTKDTAGEFIYILCDQDASKFVDQVGYGNAIGFLTNRGIPFSHPTSHSQGENGSSVNPVTGQYVDKEAPDLSTMTDEEKEQEAERLFVLFERLNKTGVIKVKNPIVEAMQSGKIHEIDDEN